MAIQLLAAGLILLAVESFIPGFGIFGISGLLCLLGALYPAQAAGWAAMSSCISVLRQPGAIRARRNGRIFWAGRGSPRRSCVLPAVP